MATQMSLHAHPRYLIATDAGAFILSVLVLFVIFRVRLLLSPLAFTVLVILMAAGFGVDIGRWFAVHGNPQRHAWRANRQKVLAKGCPVPAGAS